MISSELGGLGWGTVQCAKGLFCKHGGLCSDSHFHCISLEVVAPICNPELGAQKWVDPGAC